jgi:hypothetical protein
MCFSRQGFTREALEWAEQAGVALFRFDLSGEPDPVNAAALRIVKEAPEFEGVSGDRRANAHGIAADVPVVTQDLTLPSGDAQRILGRLAKTGLRRRDDLEDALQFWFLVHAVTLTMTVPSGKRAMVHQQQSLLCVDDLTAERSEFNPDWNKIRYDGGRLPFMGQSSTTTEVASTLESSFSPDFQIQVKRTPATNSPSVSRPTPDTRC